MTIHLRLLALLIPPLLLSSGCTAVKVADATASAVVGVTKGTVKTTGRVIGAVIPGGKNDAGDKEGDG